MDFYPVKLVENLKRKNKMFLQNVFTKTDKTLIKSGLSVISCGAGGG